MTIIVNRKDNSIEEMPICPVCDICEAGRHNHYGGKGCNSCRSFFRRAVQSEAYKVIFILIFLES